MALREEFLGQDGTPFPGPCHSVGVQLSKTKKERLVCFAVHEKDKANHRFHNKIIRSKSTVRANVSVYVTVHASVLNLQHRGLACPDLPRQGRRG